MPVVVACKGGEGWRLEGSWPDAEVANRFLAHLATRAFSPATVRAYTYDLVNFGRFCVERGVRVADAVPTDFFDYLEWQGRPAPTRGVRVVQLAARRPAAATMNRRISAIRALFEFALLAGVRPDSPVPSPRRSSGLRARRRGLLGHLPARRQRRGGRLVQQPRPLPDSLEPGEVAAFLADLSTHRDRAVALAMLLGGLRAAEVRALRLADVDMGLSRCARRPARCRPTRPRSSCRRRSSRCFSRWIRSTDDAQARGDRPTCQLRASGATTDATLLSISRMLAPMLGGQPPRVASARPLPGVP